MEAANSLLSLSPSVPLRKHPRGCPRPVFMLHERVVSAIASPPTGIAHHFSTSVLQEQHVDYKSLMYMLKEGRELQGTLSRLQMESEWPVLNENTNNDYDESPTNLGHKIFNWPCLWHLVSSIQIKGGASQSLMLQSPPIEFENLVTETKKSLLALEQEALLVRNRALFGPVNDLAVGNKKLVRSTRLGDRHSKKRKVSKPKVMEPEALVLGKTDLRRKIHEELDENDLLRFLLRGPDTKQLLTFKEESELIVEIQGLMSLEEVKRKLQYQSEHEPTVAEWAAAAGFSCQDVESQLHSGNRSRARLINANLRMVVHIAKHYQGHGLSLQDLVQEGSVGLIKSIEKYKPHAGCRFSSYAYWWIRQAIRKGVFQNSRTIRLPENVHELLIKVSQANGSYIREGHHEPTEEQVATRAGITVERLRQLLSYSRPPISMQQAVWVDEKTTFQEVTADTKVESPDRSVAKQFMRRHARGLVCMLPAKERQVIRQRYGILDGRPKSLSEVGKTMGLSKERVRQVESRALCRLRECLDSHGLGAYADLLV